MTLIETKTLATSAAAIEFTSIPQDGTDLIVYASARSTGDGTRNMLITINGSTSGLSGRFLFGGGSSVSSGTDTRETGAYNHSSSTSSTFSNVSMYFTNYSGSTNKVWSVDSVIENNAADGGLYIDAKLWSNTEPITSLAFTPNTGSFSAGTTISLYKVIKGSDGKVTVS
jgi:hypothetical protein